MLCSRVQRWSFARSSRSRGSSSGGRDRQGLGCPRRPPAAELPPLLPRHFDHGVWLSRACKSPAFIRKFCSSSGWGVDDAFPNRKFPIWIVAGGGAHGCDVGRNCKRPHPRTGAGLQRRRVPPLQRSNSRCRPCDGVHGRQKVPALAGLPGSFQARCRAARSRGQARRPLIGPAARKPGTGQTCRCYGEPVEKAGKARHDVVAARHFKVPSRDRLTLC